MDADFLRKLGIKDGHAIALEDVPADFEGALRAILPSACDVREGVPHGAKVDVILLWADEATGSRFPSLQSALKPDGALWVVIPKKTHAARTGPPITFDGVQRAALSTDLVDNKTLTFSETHYGIRFVIRKEKRAAR